MTRPLLAAIETLKVLNTTGARHLPDDAPTSFVRRRWAPLVMPDGVLDRKFYELCAMSELKNALRSGDVWVVGSRQFKEFDEYLLTRADYAQRVRESRLGLQVPTQCREYLEERLTKLRKSIAATEALAALLADFETEVSTVEEWLSNLHLRDPEAEVTGRLAPATGAEALAV